VAVKFTHPTLYRVTACFYFSYQEIQSVADNNIQTKNQESPDPYLTGSISFHLNGWITSYVE
jgi:hypothetical protein